MFKKLKNLTDKQIKILSKIIDMREYNFDTFWEDVINVRNAKYPNPKFITGYEARKHYGFTDHVVRNLVRDGLIRTDVQGPIKYALEDLLLMKKVRDNWAKVEQAEIVKETVIQGKKKYLIMDIFRRDNSLDKYQYEIMTMLLTDLFGETYHLIPKNLTLDEKKQLLAGLDK